MISRLEIILNSGIGLLRMFDIIEDFDLHYDYDMDKDTVNDTSFYISTSELIYKDYSAIISRIQSLIINESKLFLVEDSGSNNVKHNKVKIDLSEIKSLIEECGQYFYKEGNEIFIGVSLVNYNYIKKNYRLNHYVPSNDNVIMKNRGRDNFFFKLSDIKEDITCLVDPAMESTRRHILLKSLSLGYFKLLPELEFMVNNYLNKMFLRWSF